MCYAKKLKIWLMEELNNFSGRVILVCWLNAAGQGLTTIKEKCLREAAAAGTACQEMLLRMRRKNLSAAAVAEPVTGVQ